MAEVRNTSTGMSVPYLGASVVFHTAGTDGQARFMAALVTAPGEGGRGLYEGDVMLAVFPPGWHDMRVVSCASYGRQPGEWSWPERM